MTEQEYQLLNADMDVALVPEAVAAYNRSEAVNGALLALRNVDSVQFDTVRRLSYQEQCAYFKL